VLVERVGGYGHLDPFAPAGDNGKRRRPGVVTHMLCWS
jgi:hypothetical protein